jgi:hydroxymethylglutaryl-CoA synthase
MEAVEMTYRKAEEILGETLWDSLSAHTFHVPFPKMVYKAWQCLKRKISLSEKEWEDLYSSRVEPFMSLNRRIGNGYTASLWFSVAKAWDLLKKGEVFSLFSYGSGYGSELFFLKIEKKPPVEWMKEFENFLSARKRIDGETYERWRQSEKETILPLNL